mgnify:FL=1
MKQKHIIFLLLTSFFLLQPLSLSAQEDQQGDSLQVREKYGLRLGVDLSKPLRSIVDEDYKGLEVVGDYRIYKNYYLAAELGNEQMHIQEENITAFNKGSYIKLGANYNAYKNWEGMQNEIYVGLRYGFATFSSDLREYSIYNRNDFFEPDIRMENQEFNKLTAGWLEVQLGVKVEVLKNLYLGAHFQLKRRINENAPSLFENLYIPGFGRTYTDSTIGAGYGYSISYLIPLYKI